MANKAIVRYFVSGLLAGIVASSFFVIPWVLLIIIAIGLLCWRPYHAIRWLMIVGFLIGWWRTSFVLRQQVILPQRIQTEARVVFRDFDDDQQVLRVRLVDYPAILLVYLDRFPVYHYGDTISLTCDPQLTSTDDNTSRRRHLQMLGIGARCYRATSVKVTASLDWRSPFFQFKDYVMHIYQRTLPGSVAGLMQAMIMNERGEVAQTTKDNFSRSGLSHIVAISGMNMTLLIVAGQTLCGRLGMRRRHSAILLITVLILYVMIIGAPASAVRAAIMSSLLLVGHIVRRPIDITHTVIVVAGVLALWNPLAVVYDIGWQLSFLALAGLIWWTPWWTTTLRWIPERAGLREIMSATLAAQMFTWPLILYYFGVWPVWFLPANILTVPLIGPIMISGLLLPLLWWIPIIGTVLRLLITLLIRWLLWVVNTTGALPLAVVPLSFSLTALISSYIGIIIITRVVYEKNNIH